MEVILSQQCLSLVGTLERGLGYHLVQRKNGFFARRDSKGIVPPDGHWRFIVLCAEMAQNGLYIKDIRVSAIELRRAINEAGRLWGDSLADAPDNQIYNASDVLRFKWKWCL